MTEPHIEPNNEDIPQDIALVNIYQQAQAQPVDEPVLAQAKARLAAMPLESLSEPAPFEPKSSMPPARNPYFINRAADLQQLAQALHPQQGETALAEADPGRSAQRMAVITGLDGVGKTQLAGEFVHRYGQYFAGGVFWVNMATPAAGPAEIAKCGLPVAPSGYSSLTLAEQLRWVSALWHSPLPRLLVFDNCEDEALLERWRPKRGGCRLLVTSRRENWSRALTPQVWPVGRLERSESVALLRGYLPELSELAATLAGELAAELTTELTAIAAELDDWPLALQLAGCYLARYQDQVSPAAYLAQLRDKAWPEHPALAGRGVEPALSGPELNVARPFALSYDRLNSAEAGDQLALALLHRAAYFAPDLPIPRQLLLKTLPHAQDDREAPLLAENALLILTELGWLKTEAEGALSLHHLPAALVRQIAGDDEAQQAVEEALLRESEQLNQANYPALLLEWQTHLRTVTDRAQGREDERAATLSNALGRHLEIMADYEAARSYFERALTIRQQVLGPEHPDTATSLNNLGDLLEATGDLAAARPYFEQALAIREKVLGPEHIDTATSLNNLGDLLQTTDDLAAARPYFEQALAIRQQLLGPEHPDIATSLSNLGYLRQAMGDLRAARPYFEQALAIKEKVLGPEHPDTATSLNNLAHLLQLMGDLAAARPYFERALTIKEQVLGPEHPAAAQSMNNLGYLLYLMGDRAAAQPYFERALTIYEENLGPGHPATQAVQNNLYRLDDAGPAASRPSSILATFRRLLGDKKP